MVDVQNTPINTAATRLPPVGLCGILAQSVFHLVGPLKKHLSGNRCKNDMTVPAGVSKSLLSQCTISYAEGKD
jgi:hypothetical protein